MMTIWTIGLLIILMSSQSSGAVSSPKCEPNWTYFNSYCYKYHPYNYNFFESLFICKEFYNSSILTLLSDEEEQFVTNWLNKEMPHEQGVWLGVQKFSDQWFRFVDGSPLTYFKLKNQNQSNDNYCAAIESDKISLRWITKECRDLFYLVCKKPQLKVTEAPVDANLTSKNCESKVLTSKISNHESIPDELKKMFNYLDSNQEQFVKTLAEAIAIKSVSGIPENRPEVIHMVHWLADILREEDVDVELVDIGNQTLPNGQELPLPPILLGQLGNDTNKKTVCIYGHLDVQPARLEDGWLTDPFKLIEIDGKLFGRGASDDKGPVMAWIFAIQAYKKLGIEIPINIKVRPLNEVGTF